MRTFHLTDRVRLTVGKKLATRPVVFGKTPVGAGHLWLFATPWFILAVWPTGWGLKGWTARFAAVRARAVPHGPKPVTV